MTRIVSSPPGSEDWPTFGHVASEPDGQGFTKTACGLLTKTFLSENNVGYYRIACVTCRKIVGDVDDARQRPSTDRWGVTHIGRLVAETHATGRTVTLEVKLFVTVCDRSVQRRDNGRSNDRIVNCMACLARKGT